MSQFLILRVLGVQNLDQFKVLLLVQIFVFHSLGRLYERVEHVVVNGSAFLHFMQHAKNFFTRLCHAIRLLKSESSHDSELQQLAGQYFLSPNFNFFLYDLKRSLWVGLKVFENLSDLTLEGCAVS